MAHVPRKAAANIYHNWDLIMKISWEYDKKGHQRRKLVYSSNNDEATG